MFRAWLRFVLVLLSRGCVAGLGLLALDDVFGLHAQAVNAALSTPVANCSLSDPPSVTLQDLQFGMAANTSAGHTVEWAVYATGGGCTTDPYYCFVNAAREDLGVNALPIAGNGIINAMRWGQRLEPLGRAGGLPGELQPLRASDPVAQPAMGRMFGRA